MIEVEAILNSRPLTKVARQPDNEEPLTLNHFLIQRPYSSLPPGSFGEKKPTAFNKHVQQSMNHVSLRLIKENLSKLIKRKKWTDNKQPHLKIDAVWLFRDLTPRKNWNLGRKEETAPRRDGEVRVVNVKTAYGSCVRSPASHGFFFSPYFL